MNKNEKQKHNLFHILDIMLIKLINLSCADCVGIWSTDQILCKTELKLYWSVLIRMIFHHNKKQKMKKKIMKTLFVEIKKKPIRKIMYLFVVYLLVKSYWNRTKIV